MSFKEYQSKPVIRLAYELKEGDYIGKSGFDRYCTVIDGKRVTFTANKVPLVGDFVIYINDEDIYHCPRSIFLDRNTVDEEAGTTKTLHNSDVSGARKNVQDLQIVGDGDNFTLICKASSQSEGWMKSSKAMETPHGCVVQVTTQQRNPDGSYSVAEALTFVPGVQVEKLNNGGARLV